MVLEDLRDVIYDRVFYHTSGFQFTARKGHVYTLRFVKEGTPKLIVMYL